MARRDPRVPITHMLDAISGIGRVAALAPAEAIGGDWVLSRALERGFEILSEASRRLPEELKASEPDIPWRDIAGIGNILRHDYDGVEVSLLLTTAARDLPGLEAALRRMLARL